MGLWKCSIFLACLGEFQLCITSELFVLRQMRAPHLLLQVARTPSHIHELINQSLFSFCLIFSLHVYISIVHPVIEAFFLRYKKKVPYFIKIELLAILGITDPKQVLKVIFFTDTVFVHHISQLVSEFCESFGVSPK